MKTREKNAQRKLPAKKIIIPVKMLQILALVKVSFAEVTKVTMFHFAVAKNL